MMKNGVPNHTQLGVTPIVKLSSGQLIEIEGNFLKSLGLLSLRERKWKIINNKKNTKH